MSDDKSVDSVLLAIKEMVHKEASSRFKGSLEEEIPFLHEATQEVEKIENSGKLVFAPEPEFKSGYESTAPTNPAPDHGVPGNVYILHPHMRVDKPVSTPEILDEGADTSVDDAAESKNASMMNVSFAIGNASVDEDMLRNMVREVVQEQLRGELGREILNAVRMDLIGFIDD